MTVVVFYYPATWVKSKGAMKPKWQDSRRYEFTQCWFGLPVYWRELVGGMQEFVRIIDCVKRYQGLTGIGVTCLLILVSPLKQK